MSIAGASQYRIASEYSQLTQQAAQPAASLLGGTAVSLLDVGRGLNPGLGVGLSNSARALNAQQIGRDANSLFSSTIGASSTLEGLQTQISALRSQANINDLSRDLQLEIAEEAIERAESVQSDRGTLVDTEA